MGRGFLTEPGAVTVRKEERYAVFTEPLDRGGILSLSPLGLGKVIEGYCLRSRAKKKSEGRKREREKERGKRGGLGEFLSLPDPGWEMNITVGKEQPKATQAQSNNKTQTQTQAVTVTLCPTSSRSHFHNKNMRTASEALLGHSHRCTE